LITPQWHRNTRFSDLNPKVATKVAVQPGIAVDRFAREIVRILKASPSALAATECQTVRPSPALTHLFQAAFAMLYS